MENQSAAAQDPQDTDEQLRKSLLRRVAVAGVVVVGLLAGLAVFDALHAPSPAKPPVQVAAVSPKVEEAQPAEVKPEEQPAEVVGEQKEELPAKAEPEVTEAPTGTLPPMKAERPLTVPAHARPASIRPSEPVAAVVKPEPAKEIAKAAPVLKNAPPSHPLAKAAEAVRQFFVQMGVFNEVKNAEDLRAKLELNGIPSQIEARVQVGPFATRQEAEAAREKLRALGLDGGMLVAARKQGNP